MGEACHGEGMHQAARSFRSVARLDALAPIEAGAMRRAQAPIRGHELSRIEPLGW